MKFRVHTIYKNPTAELSHRTKFSVTDDLSLPKAIQQVRESFPKDAEYFEIWNPVSNTIVYVGERG